MYRVIHGKFPHTRVSEKRIEISACQKCIVCRFTKSSITQKVEDHLSFWTTDEVECKVTTKLHLVQ